LIRSATIVVWWKVVQNGSSSDGDVKPARFSVSLPPTDYERVREEAERMRVSLAWVVREAVSVYLADSPRSPHAALPRRRKTRKG